MNRLLPIALLFLALANAIAQEEDQPTDNSVGLPAEYGDFLIGPETLSPDKDLAVIHPKLEVCDEATPPGRHHSLPRLPRPAGALPDSRHARDRMALLPE